MTPERTGEVREAYEKRFLPSRNEEWFATYLAAVRQIEEADEATFRSPEFQQSLWELDGVASVGAGSSVTVPGAYADPEVVEALWALREWKGPEDVLERARALEARFERILALVSPRHNARRPSARLVRIFATVRHGDVLCLLDWQRTRLFREWLEQPRQKLDLIGQHVLCRTALREVLGLDATPENDVLQSQFSWYAWDNVLRPVEAESAAPPPEPGQASPVTPITRLVILPAKAQRRGFNYVSNNLGVLMAMVLAAENGVDKASLDQIVAERAPALSRGSRATLFAQATALGLLSFDGTTYQTTASGHALLDGDPPAEVLAPVMARTVFGFAQILDDVGRQGGMTRVGIAQACRGYYPRWTTDFAPNQLVAWMRDLGLVKVEGVGAQASVTLTEAGEYWRSGLPADMKRPSFLLADEQPDEKAPASEASAASVTPLLTALQPPSVDAVLARFREDAHLRTLVFGEDQVRLVHAALHSAAGKRFVLLAGLSGTGKTSMARGYAQAYCQALGLDPASHYEQVAVLPDWTDPTGLIGFVNPLADPPTYQETEALRLVLTASSNVDKPYFLCLDEMNLARVEHYFAPFLSAMEGRGGLLAVHASRDPVDNIPPGVAWPENLFIVGTVNMDETTHPFSDKVLDRAFTFEFWDVDLAAWRGAAVSRGAPAAALDAVFPVLAAMSEALRPARRHFGYRTCDEVLGFVAGWSGGDLGKAVDAAILAKVLPKVRGDDGGALPAALAAALVACEAHKLSLTGGKVRQMQETLKALGAVRFWS